MKRWVRAIGRSGLRFTVVLAATWLLQFPATWARDSFFPHGSAEVALVVSILLTMAVSVLVWLWVAKPIKDEWVIYEAEHGFTFK